MENNNNNLSYFDRLKDGIDLPELLDIVKDLKTGNLDLKKILNSEFVDQNTDANSFSDLLKKFNVQDSGELMNQIQNDDPAVDKKVDQNTQFGNFTDFMTAAIKFYQQSQQGKR